MSAGPPRMARTARRALGYTKSDIGRMAAEAHRAYFNLTAPRQPTLADFERLIVEVLG